MGHGHKRTAILHIRPVDLAELSNQRYWEKWDRIDEQTLRTISHAFFERCHECRLGRGCMEMFPKMPMKSKYLDMVK